MFSFSTKGLVSGAIGVLLAFGALVKLTVVGFYPNEAIPTFIALFLGLGLVWYAKKFGRADTVEGQDRASDAVQVDRDPA